MNRFARVALISLFLWICCAVLFGTYVVRRLPTYAQVEGCRSYTLFTKPKYPSQVVFIGQPVYVGGRNEISDGPPNSGSWAIFKIEKRFWGIPFLNPGFALVANGVFQPDRKYLIAGPSSDIVLLNWLLLTVDESGCRDSMLIEGAEPQLRLLRDGAPSRGVRLIGYVRDDYGRAVSNATVLIEGENLTKVATSDSLGVYDMTVPLRKHYTIRPEKDNELDKVHRLDEGEGYQLLTDGGVWGRTVHIQTIHDSQSTSPCQQSQTTSR